MKILLGCECSGVARRALRNAGHNAFSCDIKPSMDNSEFHIREDVLGVIYREHWDGAIFFPPCTRLAVAGARWFAGKENEQRHAIEFVEKLWCSQIERIAIENPVGVLSTRSALGKPSQIVQPWWFGHGETKSTCFWLKIYLSCYHQTL